MSLQTELSDFFQEHLSVDEIRRLVVRLPHGDAIRPQLPSGAAPLMQVCEELSSILHRRNEIDEALFAQLRAMLPRLGHKITELAALSEAPATAAAWRRTVDQRLDGRLVLRDVDGAGLALDSVYVELELLLQLPTRVGVLRADEGRCEEPRRTEADAEDEGREPGEQQMDLAAWLSETAPDASMLTIEGEVGSGKTELLARTARALAQATGTDAALPLWIDAKNLVSGGLARAVADWSGWTEDACRALVQHPSLKFAVFVDSLDEAGTSISETIAAIQGALGSRLHRLVLATRSAQRRALRDARVARLAPWNIHAIDRFLARWSCADLEGVAQIRRERALGMLEEVLANPLTATFCVLVAREEPKALRNRTRLFHAIVLRIVSHWRKLRTRNDALYRRWETIFSWLGQLALERLRDYPFGLTIEVLRERLQEDSLDGADELLDDLTASYGVLIRTPHGYDFALRWLAEYLAGRSLRGDVASLDEVAGHPWAFEPVRHAIAGAPPEQVPVMIEALLADEDADEALDAPTHLRRVQLAAVVAADLRDAFPKASIDGLVQAIWRRLKGERSSWIPSEMAWAARSLARVGGPVWERLEPLLLAALLDARTDVAQWYGRQTVEQAAFWIDLLHHRDANVRVAAIGRLRHRIDDPEVRDALFAALLDEGSRDRPALAAGLALRGATRDERFAAALPDLQRLLRDGEQIQSGAAALGLLPEEAELDHLADGLLGAHNAGADVSQAVRELANSPGGTAALDGSPWRGGWRAAKHHPWPTKPEPDGAAPPVTGHVRWDLLRAIAPALHRLPQTTLRDLVHLHDHSHALSHELEQIDASVLPTIIDLMCDGYICLERIESVVRLARQHPDVGKALVARWRRIAETGMDETACVHFPGQGLTPLIEQGSEEAVDALLEWLPRSRLGQPQWANEGPPLSAAAFTHPRVLAAGRQYLQSRHPGQVPWDTEMLKRFAPAWHDIPEVWGSLVAQLQGDRHAAAWRFVSDVCTHATLPEPFAATSARLAEEFIVRHDDPHQCSTAWHSAAPSVLQFIEAHGLAPRVRFTLECLAGLQGASPCPRIQPMAAAMVISTVEAGKQIPLAEAMMRRYAENTQSLNHLAPASLAALIRPIPQAWQQLLLGQLHTFDPTAIILGSGKEYLRLLCALPARERGEVAMRLLQKRESLRLPWFKPLDNPTRRYCRPTDLLWQIAFEVGAA